MNFILILDGIKKTGFYILPESCFPIVTGYFSSKLLSKDYFTIFKYFHP